MTNSGLRASFSYGGLNGGKKKATKKATKAKKGGSK
jgi:hypothetical protein